MTLFRSCLYNVFFWTWNTVVLFGMIAFFPFPRRMMQSAVRFYTHGQRVGLKYIVGLDYEVRGRENLIDGPAIYAPKHQSAWETFVFYMLVNDPNYILKEELLAIPLWGWYARKCQGIAADRDGGATSLKQMVRDTRDRLARGRSVIIFPEGTRAPPGERLPLFPGVAALYRQCDAPVIPVALNSGLFWSRHGFRKLSGVITIEILPAIPPGLNRAQFMNELETRIQTATDRLMDEAVKRFPHTLESFDAQY